ncbi:MAG: hypothetical protein HY720_32940 [Planctomycetes bacterium]|nr:hypothetical protein [Planctomycetota bacterium]
MRPVLVDLPRPATREDYETCLAAARRILEADSRVVAAYVAGEVRHPGHSDIDLLVVLADGVDLSPAIRPADLPPPGPYLASHSFPHYPRRLFRDIHYVFPLFSPLVPLFEKKPVDTVPPPADPEERRLLAAFYAFDYLHKKVYRLLDHQDGGSLPARTLLCHLHTLRYTWSCVENATGAPFGGDFVSRVDSLRGGWFDADPGTAADELASLIQEGARLGFDAAWRLATFFAGLPGNPGGEARFVNRDEAILFTDAVAGPEEAYQASLAGRRSWRIPLAGRRIRFAPVVQPAALSAVLATYARGEGPWSAWIGRSLKAVRSASPVALSPPIQRRTAALDEIARLSLSSPLKNSYPYGFPPAGREGFARRLASALVHRRFRSFARPR